MFRNSVESRLEYAGTYGSNTKNVARSVSVTVETEALVVFYKTSAEFNKLVLIFGSQHFYDWFRGTGL